MKQPSKLLLLMLLTCAAMACKKLRKNSFETDQFTQELIKACRNGDLEKIKQLAAAGANLNARGNGESSDSVPILIATERGYDALFEYLVQGGASIDGTLGERALRVAARNGRIRIVKYLLETGISVNSGTKDFTPLMEAARYNHAEIARILISQGAVIDDIDSSNASENKTALMFAAEKRYPETIKLLLEHKADVNHRISYGPNRSGYESGWTSLIISFNDNFYDYTTDRHIKSIEYLLDGGADINAIDDCGCTALDYAIRNKFPKPGAFLVTKSGKRGTNCKLPPVEPPDLHGH